MSFDLPDEPVHLEPWNARLSGGHSGPMSAPAVLSQLHAAVQLPPLFTDNFGDELIAHPDASFTMDVPENFLISRASLNDVLGRAVAMNDPLIRQAQSAYFHEELPPLNFDLNAQAHSAPHQFQTQNPNGFYTDSSSNQPQGQQQPQMLQPEFVITAQPLQSSQGPQTFVHSGQFYGDYDTFLALDDGFQYPAPAPSSAPTTFRQDRKNVRFIPDSPDSISPQSIISASSTLLTADTDVSGFDWSFVRDENKRQKIKKWKAKKMKIVTGQSQVKTYTNRKRYAQIRPRINGRFVSKQEYESYQLALTEEQVIGSADGIGVLSEHIDRIGNAAHHSIQMISHSAPVTSRLLEDSMEAGQLMSLNAAQGRLSLPKDEAGF